MPWVRFDDTFSVHRKVDGLSDAAFRLHVSAIFWCARNLTDGAVPEEDLDLVSARVRTPARFAAELVRRGLWHQAGHRCESPNCPQAVDSGWTVHDYLEFQPSKQRVLVDREGNAKRQREFRERHRNGVSNGTPNASLTPPRPGPSRSSGTGGEVTHPPQHERDPPPERCPDHADAPADGPCGPCGDARRERQAWERDQAQQASAAQSARARERAELRRAEIGNCTLCDETGYLPTGRVCPHRKPASGAGAAAARAVLSRKEAG